MREFINRYRTGNLSHRMLLSLINRAITVIILAGVISLVATEQQGKTFLPVTTAFVAGVLPDAAFQAVTNLTKVSAGRFTIDPPSGYRGLPEIDLWKETSLVERGVNNIHDLAATDLRSLMVSVGIGPTSLLHAADRALLLHALGSGPPEAKDQDLATRLEKIPIFTR